jgi:glycosyltransferase involved in cell wall biosynthesis
MVSLWLTAGSYNFDFQDKAQSVKKLFLCSFAKTIQMRLLVLLTRFFHHGNNSGYKQLLKFTKPDFILGVNEESTDKNHGIKGKYQWLFEFAALKHKSEIDLIHIMYGEDYFRFSPWLFPKIPIVVTFHQPYESLLRDVHYGNYKGRVGAITHFFTKKRFKKIAAAIVTEASQKLALSQVMDVDKIYVIPLGVHLENFSKAYSKFLADGVPKEERQVVTVGNWKRDWQLYEDVVRHSEALSLGFKFHLVNRNLAPHMKEHLSNLGVVVHDNVDDDTLKRLIYQSSAMYLPVTEASGNNALLESLALGVPVVMTNVLKEAQSLDDRVFSLHERGNPQDALMCLKAYLNSDMDTLVSISDICRQEAKRFDWPEVANQTMELYKKVLGV